MNKIILLILIFVSIKVSAADWELFPYQQKSYYLNNSYYFPNKIRIHKMDSVKINNQDSVFYFNKNLNLPGAGNCYQQALDLAQIGVGFSDYDFIDSLVKRNDTVFYYSNWSTLPFYFLPNAQPGQSWTITSTFSGNAYNQITIVCQTIQVESFAGLTDSVKVFDLIPNGSNPNQTPITNFQIKLSKNYGLIEFVPFHFFLNHAFGTAFYNLELIGLENGGIKYGYQQPKFEDYFHLSAGDVLMWFRYHSPYNIMLPSFHKYYYDSIIQSIITVDSVVYVYDRIIKDDNNLITYLNNQTVTFIRSGFERILSAPPKWIGFGSNNLGFDPIQSNIPIWYTDYLGFRVDTITPDSIFQYSASGGEIYIDTSSCQQNWVTDLEFSFVVDTRAGIIEHCWNNFAFDCTTLIGYKINGIQSGSLSLSIDELSVSYNNIVYPNPSSNFISINLETKEIAEINIYDIVGN